MVVTIMKTLLALLSLITLIGSVKIGISKPVVISENVTTEGTTMEPTTTLKMTTISTSVRTTTIKNIPTTQLTSKSISSSTSTSTTTTTSIPPTTTIMTPPNNDSRLNSIRKTNKDRSGYFCSCDLRPFFCDINCCCDIDCISEELNSFDCHNEDDHLEDFNYLQGLPPCRINEGWLCVFRTNIDVSRNKHHNYFFEKLIFHEWPQLLREDNGPGRDRSFYKIGEPLLLYSLEVDEILEFDLPFSLVGHHCQINESVRHLKKKQSSCQLSLEKAKSLETALFQKLCTSFLLQGPNTQTPLDGIVKETFTELIPITIFFCSKEYDCVPVSNNDSNIEYLDDSAYSNLIQTKLTHNHTNLISCEVFFVQSEEKSSEIWLNYEVDFVHVNDIQGNSLNVSGPLGYTMGRPLIIGQKVLFNESAENVDSNRILSYFHTNRTQKIHIFVPRRNRELCESSQLTLNFGESILVQCSVLLDNSTEITRDSNFTNICAQLQIRTFNFFQVNEILELQDEYFISILGYPANKTDYWTKIELMSYEHLPVIGYYLDKDKSFICENMILGVKYEFLIVKEDVNGVRHQNLLNRATIEMEKRHDLKFQLDEIVSIPITFSTVFHDLQVVNKAIRWTAFGIVFLISLIVSYI
ncbi:tectonic [Eupeodes corollae]|uniref:tectonic n=1 Tax=Eupeodes corollae TaxID=290404 RepID=UPI0024906CF8|nr:tectonic [Eupeodes corollae]